MIRRAEPMVTSYSDFQTIDAEALRDGETRDATNTLRALFAYLRQDYRGRDAHRHLARDPIEVLRHFVEDERYRPPDARANGKRD